MTLFRTTVSVAALFIATGGALGADVSAGGAQALTSTFESYLGKGSDGVSPVRVTPTAANDGYDVSIDAARLTKPLEQLGVKVGPALFGFVLKPKADGTWDYAQSTYPTIDITHQGGSMKISYEGVAIKGIYDPKIYAFTTMDAQVKRTVQAAEDPQSKIAAEVGDQKMTMTGRDAGGGLVSGTVDQTIGTFSENVEFKDGSLPPIKIGAGPIAARGAYDGAASKGILDLWAFFVANPAKDKLVAAQDQFKSKILAALPLWRTLNISADVSNVVIDTPMGSGKISKLTFMENINGVVSEGLFEFGLGLGAVDLPAQLLPAWSAGLIPSETQLGLKVTGYDLDRLVKLSVSRMNLKNDKNPVAVSSQEALTALIPNGNLNLLLTPGKLVAADYSVTWEGTMQVNPATQAGSGKAKVTAKGLDAVAAKLSKVPEAMQLVTGIYAAKAMSKPVGGADVWEIEFDTRGKIVINGQKISG